MDAVNTVAVVESKPIFLEGLRSIIQNSGYRVVFCARQLDAISDEDLRSAPSLVLASCSNDQIDLQVAEIQRIRQRIPAAKFVLLVDAVNAEGNLQLWPLIDGFIFRTVDPQALPKALELVLLGERVILGMVREMTVGGPAHSLSGSIDNPHLSRREQDVLRSLSGGSSNKVIARDMGLSESTVKVHVKGILRKLKAGNRTEAAVWARTNGFTPMCRPDAER